MMYDSKPAKTRKKGSPPFVPEDRDPQEKPQRFNRPAQRPAIMEGENGRPRTKPYGGMEKPELSSGHETPPFYPGGYGRHKGDVAPGNDDNTFSALGGKLGADGDLEQLDDNAYAEPGDAAQNAANLAHRQMGGIGDSFPGMEPSINEPGGGKIDPAEHTKPSLANPDVRAISQTIRSRGPEVQALVQRRMAQQAERFRNYGDTPTGADPDAPRPKLARGRRGYNPYRGRYS